MSSALNTFSDRVAHRRVTPAGSSRLLSMSSWSSFESFFSAYRFKIEKEEEPKYLHEEEEASCALPVKAIRDLSYRRLVSSSHHKEADFEVAFSSRIGITWVI